MDSLAEWTRDLPHSVRFIRSDGNVGLLCARGSESMVHSRIRWGMRFGISLWLLTRSMAVWLSRIYLVSRRHSTVGNKVEVT